MARDAQYRSTGRRLRRYEKVNLIMIGLFSLAMTALGMGATALLLLLFR